MSNYEWPANDYAIGAYIQAMITDKYLERLATKVDDKILDIGCGDGSYTTKLLERVPDGSLIGLDRSMNMLQLAREKIIDYPNFSVQLSDVLEMDFNDQFDYIVSFWCLHWCPDLKGAFTNIYRALKNGAKLMTIIPTGVTDTFMTSFNMVKSSGDFQSLLNFRPLVDFENVAKIPEIIASLPFKNAEVETMEHTIKLPSLDTFRKFVNGLAFFQGQVPDKDIRDINEAIVRAFDLECCEEYQGEHWATFSIYLITAEK
jgi:ubiquinone/menaquinone biosynthesis C-methylase UbiE